MSPPFSLRTTLGLFVLLVFTGLPSWAQSVEQYGVFETTITHDASRYDNAFTDVELNATFTAPSGETIDFHGFYDGNGRGGNDGNVWKLRFMPEETGEYTYTWTIVDVSGGGSGSVEDRGSGSFEVTASDRKPPLQVCDSDPRWLCYGGEGEPMLLKGYLPHRQHPTETSWMKENVFQPLADAGYNHVMVAGIPSHFNNDTWSDYNGPVLTDDAVTNETEPFRGTVNLNVWHRWDEQLEVLNDLGLQAWFWTGLGGAPGRAVNFAAMSRENKEAWIRYSTARWAPLSNVAWGFWYEQDVDDAFWPLIEKYDPFDHLVSGQWHPQNTMGSPYEADDADLKATDWYPTSHAAEWRYSDDANPQNLHDRILSDRERQEAVTGTTMPYFNAESAAWTTLFDIDTTPEEFAGVIWASITAEAYFNWAWATVCADGNSNCSSSDLLNGGYNEIAQVAYHVLEEEVERWYDLESRDDLLATGDEGVWVMAEPGTQYLVFSHGGEDFELEVAPGEDDAGYVATWIDARTGASEDASEVSGGSSVALTPPSTSTDWVLVLNQASDNPSDGDDEPDDDDQPDDDLPVELSEFDAVREGEGVVLSWETLSETENAGFAVERRSNVASNWTEVGFVEGAGTTTEPQSYRFTDRFDDSELPAGAERLVYRLKQVDRDGAHEYSAEVEVRLETSGQLTFHGNAPNPFQERTTIRYEVEQPGQVQVAVYDVLGRLVQRLVDGYQGAGEHTVALDGHGLAAGVYVVVLEASGERITRRMTLVR